jgi:hypothetical protein
MPYVQCPRCGLWSFTAAHWLNADHCARCDIELPRGRSAAFSDERFQRLPKSWPPPTAERSNEEGVK